MVLIPLSATLLYYGTPNDLRTLPWLMFGPQLLAYVSLAIWMLRNSTPWARLGLHPSGWSNGLRRGALIGTVLGAVNVTVIIWVIPGLGGDLSFLRDTPHAKAPVWMMFPVGISIIGALVELNFRGFQLGRLAALGGLSPTAQIAAIVVSAFSFSWDPFMVHVFRGLHWMAFSDGLIWGILLLRTRTLYATIVAHTVEVWIMYVLLKLWFG